MSWGDNWSSGAGVTVPLCYINGQLLIFHCQQHWYGRQPVTGLVSCYHQVGRSPCQLVHCQPFTSVTNEQKLGSMSRWLSFNTKPAMFIGLIRLSDKGYLLRFNEMTSGTWGDMGYKDSSPGWKCQWPSIQSGPPTFLEYIELRQLFKAIWTATHSYLHSGFWNCCASPPDTVDYLAHLDEMPGAVTNQSRTWWAADENRLERQVYILLLGCKN